MDKILIQEIIGYLAAVLTTAAYVPQAFKTIKSRKTSDISLFMYLLMFTGVIGWLIYGIMHNSLPIILANGITMSLVAIILIMKMRYK